MELYDIVMLVVLAAATIFGFWKGMAWQIASLASLLLSYGVALKFSPALAPLFGDQEPWNRFVAMFVVYVATSLVIWLAFRVVAGAIDRVQLKEFDRQLGGVFGFAKGVLLCVAITLFAVSLLPDSQRANILDSRSGYYIALLLNRTHDVIPDELHEVLHPYLHKAEKTLDAEHPDEERCEPEPIPHMAEQAAARFS